MRKLIATSNDGVLLLLRLVLGVVMFAHGAQKVLGWFGGPGFSGTMQMFTTGMHIPYGVAILPVLAEFLGGLGLIVGLLGRIAALGILCDMLVAVWLVHSHNGFFMNWTGQQKGEGFEYHLLAIVVALAIIIRGSGMASIDRALSGPAAAVPAEHPYTA
jgi:putative oxidoreductase